MDTSRQNGLSTWQMGEGQAQPKGLIDLPYFSMGA